MQLIHRLWFNLNGVDTLKIWVDAAFRNEGRYSASAWINKEKKKDDNNKKN